jgi:hypothetical protein
VHSKDSRLKSIFRDTWWRNFPANDGEALLLREADRKISLPRRVAGCFSNTGEPRRGLFLIRRKGMRLPTGT